MLLRMRAGNFSPDSANNACFLFMVAQPMRRVPRSAGILPALFWRSHGTGGTPALLAPRCVRACERFRYNEICPCEGDEGDFRRKHRTEKTRTAAAQRRPLAAWAIAHAKVAGPALRRSTPRRSAHVGFSHRWLSRKAGAVHLG